MADINLLPEEIRSKEQKERDQARKKPKVMEVSLTDPKHAKKGKKNGWHKLFGGFRKSAFQPKTLDKAEPAAAKNGNLKLPKIDISGLFKKIKPLVPAPKTDKSKDLPSDKNKVEPAGTLDSAPLNLKEEKISAGLKEGINSKQALSNVMQPNLKPKTKELKADQKTPDNKGRIKSESISLSSGLINKIRKVVYKLVNRKKSEPAIEVDLMPERLITFKEVNWSRVIRMLLISIAVGVSVTFIGYLILLDRSQEQEDNFRSLQDEISSFNVQITSLLDEQQSALLLQKKLQLADTLISDHVYWSGFLDFLELNTLDGVYWSGLSVSAESREVILNGIARDLATVFWQREAFLEAKESVQKVEITSTMVGPNLRDVDFSIKLILRPSVIRK